MSLAGWVEVLFIALLAFIAWLNIWWHKQWKNMTPEERQHFKDEYRNGGDW